MLKIFIRLFSVGIFFSVPACSIFLGNIKPSVEKSARYSVLDLTEHGADWIKLSPDEIETSPRKSVDTEVSDLAYQSKQTASVISLNSSCIQETENEKDLREQSDLLLLGISETQVLTRENFDVYGFAGLKTVIEGKVNQDLLRMETVVFRENGCLYDMMLVSRPDAFTRDQETFARFVQSFKLR